MPQIRNRGSNVWQIIVFLGKDDEGKKQAYYDTFHGSKPQAKLYANKLELELRAKKNSPDAHNMSMDELFSRFLEYKKSRLEESTFQKYECEIKKLRNLLGDLNLYSLNTTLIEDRLTLLEQTHLAARTIRNYYHTLSNVLNWGIAKDYLSKNPMVGVESPRVCHKKRNILNAEQLELFIKAAKDYKHFLPLKILALTGMRVGELMGLKWENVFLEERKIRIVEAVNSRLRYSKSTKTENSKREIELDEITAKELIEHKNNMSKVNKTDGNDYVFQSDDGSALRYQVILKAKNRVLKQAGLHHIRIHDLRHGVGSIMLDKGASITTVAEQLGQVPATTAGNYVHALRKGKSIASLIISSVPNDSVKNSVISSETIDTARL